MREIDIYGTLGPSCQDEKIIQRMFELGMTGMRLNLSHTGLNQCREWLKHFHSAAENAGVLPKLLADLQGPELRTGNQEPWVLPAGVQIRIGAGGLPVPALIFAEMKKGQQILLDDGKYLLEVEELIREHDSEPGACCTVIRGGTLKPRKSMALPQLRVKPPTLTDSDKLNLALAKSCGITGVMLPFVRGARDLHCLRSALDQLGAGDIKVFAKIENTDGVDKLSELLPAADTIVIARGDLGNAMPLWDLPGVQLKIGEACKAAGKPYMVVTQMLASMEQSAVPTRAEVSDIFYAILHGASSVMLTGETAAGRYPVEAMEYMCKTVQSAAACKPL